MSAFPRSLSFITVSVGGLALFLIFASAILISYPIGSTVRVYFYDDDSGKTVRWHNETAVDTRLVDSIDEFNKNLPANPGSKVPMNSSGQLIDSGTSGGVNEPSPIPFSSSNVRQEEDISSYVSSNSTVNLKIFSPLSMDLENNSDVTDTRSNDASSFPEGVGTSVDSGINQISVHFYLSSSDLLYVLMPPCSKVSMNSSGQLLDSGTDGRVNKSEPIPFSSSNVRQEEVISSYVSSNSTDNVEIASPLSMDLENNSDVTDTRSNPSIPSSSLPEGVGTSVDSGINQISVHFYLCSSDLLYVPIPILVKKCPFHLVNYLIQEPMEG